MLKGMVKTANYTDCLYQFLLQHFLRVGKLFNTRIRVCHNKKQTPQRLIKSNDQNEIQKATNEIINTL